MMGAVPPEKGEKVGEYASYEGAQKAVSALVEADIPARDIAIIGTGLRSIERVTGKLGYASAARSGALNGILLGLIFAAVFVMGSPNAGMQTFAGVMLVGIAVGMLLSIVTYSLLRRRRDFASVTQVTADHYEVTVLSRSIHRAREVLGHLPSTATRQSPVDPSTLPPPQFGERIDPASPPRYGERGGAAAAQPTAPTGSGDAPSGSEEAVQGAPRYGERIDPETRPKDDDTPSS